MNELLGRINFRQIIFRGKSYDQPFVETAIDNLAVYLLKNIHSTSPFILFSAHNHIKTVIAFYAILKAGKIAVVLDPGTKVIELAEIIADVDPAAMIFINNDRTSFNYSNEIVFRNSRKGFKIKSDLTDVCTIAYTNAEDGYSKGVMLTWQNLLSEIRAMIGSIRINKQTCVCTFLPLHHLYGLVVGTIVPTQAGISSLITGLDILRIDKVIHEMEQSKVTHLYTVPSIYYILSKIPGIEKALPEVKEFFSGGIKLPGFIFEQFYNKTGNKIREGYGLTESSPTVAIDYLGDEPIRDSIGPVLRGCQIKIVDENNKECKPNVQGELCIKGDMVFKGYFNNEEATRQVLKDGWLYTGDWGKKDNKENLFYCGLKKNMYNVAGNNVYPKKMERLIHINPNVTSVKAYSEESVLQGQIVGAHIKLRNNSKKSQEQLKEWCIQNINKTLLPRIWLFE